MSHKINKLKTIGGGYLNKEFPCKIHIIGSVGSGKITLAKELSVKLDIRIR